ncbi:MAG: GHMP kinase [Flavobacteriaceae bacterium]|nr:GHMP kinase [Flavobacteriaceae bacterium]
MKSFYSHGKLLISGEYLVLDGARALAIPTRFGQWLHVRENSDNLLKWRSLDENEKPWYSGAFIRQNGEWIGQDEENITMRLRQILNIANILNPDFLREEIGYDVVSMLEFSRDWGLGSSSTLLNNIAQWANVDAFELSELTFGGSGYDIACAMYSHPILYNKANGSRQIDSIDFSPDFQSNLYFLHLNKKQDSRQAIASYRESELVTESLIRTISKLSEDMAACTTLVRFQKLMEQHEEIISDILGIKPVSQRLFPDFEGSIKSLGAWGGDFVLVASEEDPRDYFRKKAYQTLVPFGEMILK